MLESLILGIIQGITEFFPISSTAHLVIFPWVFKWKGLVNSLSFDVALHTGTFFSLLICFWKDMGEIFRKKQKLLYLILVGTVPAGLAGVFFNEYISGPLRGPVFISLMLILFGIVMYVSERFRTNKKLDRIGVVDALLIGIAQALALMPGVSRSGVTIAAGLMRGIKREEAARFSFLLSMPAVAGATILEGRKLFGNPEPHDLSLAAAGFAAALVTGVLAIKFLLKYLKNHTLNVFIVYRFVLAGMIMGWLWIGG